MPEFDAAKSIRVAGARQGLACAVAAIPNHTAHATMINCLIIRNFVSTGELVKGPIGRKMFCAFYHVYRVMMGYLFDPGALTPPR